MTLVLLSLLACKKVEPAPEDLDGLAHYFWQRFDTTDAAELSSGIPNLHDALSAAALDGPVDGTLTDITAEETPDAVVPTGDPEDAAGVYMGNVIYCSLADIEPGVFASNQDELHEGTYVAYDREYTSDVDAYLAREEEMLTWLTSYEVEGLGANYSANLYGWLRYTPESEESPYGPFLLSRGVLVEPTWFNDSDERGMFQDYQMEIYYERAPGETVHFYAIWREMLYTGSADFDSETVQRFVLNGLADWDEDTQARCGG